METKVQKLFNMIFLLSCSHMIQHLSTF